MQKIDILSKIENLFYNKSFSDVSMNEIAESLDIKKASLYYYFPSKEKLIKELLDFSYQEYKDFLLEILDDSLEKFIKKFIHYPEESKNIFSVIVQNNYSEYAKNTEDIIKRQKEIFEIVHHSLQKKYDMSKERSFLLLCLLEEIWRKRCVNKDCPIDMKKLTQEIYTIITV